MSETPGEMPAELRRKEAWTGRTTLRFSSRDNRWEREQDTAHLFCRNR